MGDVAFDAAWKGLQPLAQLPDWLTAASDPDQIAGALARAIPEVASGELVVRGCDNRRPRLKEGAWTFSCTVTVETPDGEGRAVELEGRLQRPAPATINQDQPRVVFGSEPWQGVDVETGLEFRSAPPNPALAVLPDLTDRERSRALLEEALRSSSPARSDLRIAESSPRVARFRSENRCTVVYQLKYPAEAERRGWPDLVVAKAYGGPKGQIASAAMGVLWNSDLAQSSVVTIAEPIAFLPDLKVLIQGPVREDMTFKELIQASLDPGSRRHPDQLDAYLAQTAAGLAELHRCGVHDGAVYTAEDLATEIRAVIERLTGPVPELAGSVAPLLGWLSDFGDRHPADTSVPCHGSFRPAQVLLHQGRVGFIDFDSFCQAEPACDIALFRAAIKDIGAGLRRAPGSDPASAAGALEEIADQFLRHYQARAPVSPERVMLWEALDLLTYLLHAWTKVSPKRLEGRLDALRRHLLSSPALAAAGAG